jgi:hypothetical protein
MSWYDDFSGVQTISDAGLGAIPLGGNVHYRPGTRLVKITTDPKVYAIEPGGVLRWVPDEATAVALYGSQWSKQIDDLPDAFFAPPNYSINSPLVTGGNKLPIGHLAKGSDNKVYYIVSATQKREVTATGLTANRLQNKYVRTVTDDALSVMSNGTQISTVENSLIDASEYFARNGS